MASHARGRVSSAARRVAISSVKGREGSAGGGAVTVLLDDTPEHGVPVERGPAQAGMGGNGGECHCLSGNVTAAVEYKILNGDQPPQRAVELFANEVAVMTSFPYLREGIASIPSKVFGTPVTLPIAQRGQIGFDVTDD